MSTDPDERPTALELTSEDTLLLLNRATLVMHMVRSTAHELNNVLQMISGSAELLELNPDFPQAMRPRLEAIGNHTSRGCDLVASVADLARAQPPRGHVADAARAIERVARMRRFEQARAAVDLTLTMPVGEPLVVRADAQDLQMMLLNLVINAEQAVAEAPVKTIAITARDDGAVCRITIADSGQGILREADYFSPLVTTRSPRAASGLGLAATRVLAARHRGEVVLRQGATGVEAVLTLPLQDRQQL